MWQIIIQFQPRIGCGQPFGPGSSRCFLDEGKNPIYFEDVSNMNKCQTCGDGSKPTITMFVRNAMYFGVYQGTRVLTHSNVNQQVKTHVITMFSDPLTWSQAAAILGGTAGRLVRCGAFHGHRL